MKKGNHKVSSALRVITTPLFLLFLIISLSSHDLFLKMDAYFLEVSQKARLSLYNGTFETSENIITRDRILDASLVGLGKRTAIKDEKWEDQDSTITHMNFSVGDEGTYVAGVSTLPRNIELTAEKFNSYLEHDGVLDILEKRKKHGTLNLDAVESYQKHVKAIYQVGNTKTDDWKTVLGYPIEFVPLQNPYNVFTGDTINVQLFLEGSPLAEQLVYADYISSGHGHSHHDHSHSHSHSHSHNEDDGHSHTSGQKLRTNADGIIKVSLPSDGIYYLRTIYMEELKNDTELTHQSKWATLTFEVTHSHTSSINGIPYWMIGAFGFLILGLIYFFLKKRNKNS